jgi:hypothetical protein
MTERPVTDDVPPEEVFPIALFVLIIVGTAITGGIYEGLERPQPDALPSLTQVATGLALWSWFSAYAHRHRIPLILDLG